MSQCKLKLTFARISWVVAPLVRRLIVGAETTAPVFSGRLDMASVRVRPCEGDAGTLGGDAIYSK